MTDHAKIAEAFLVGAEHSEPGTSTEVASLLVATGQAYATLALMEQQSRVADELHIANLIAYASHRNDHKNSGGPADYPQALRLALLAMDFKIREGLRVDGDD